MTGVHQALLAFWQQFGRPVYLSGKVPENEKGEIIAEYPYLTINIAQEDIFGRTVLTAFDWHKAQSGANINAERASLMDAISAAIPAEGKRLETADGVLVLDRAASFQTLYDDPTDPTVIGGRTAYEVRYYVR